MPFETPEEIMENRIDEITRKIYNEGVIKAKEDAEQLLSEAQLKAERIVSEASQKHDELIAKTRREVEEIRKKSETELKLAGHQFISNLKQQITELITTRQVEEPVENVFNETEFLQQTILSVIKKWDAENTNELEILLPKAHRSEMDEFFKSKAIETLNKGLVVNYDERLGEGFKIGPKDSGYFINFTDQDFINYFKQYLRENTKKLLFDQTE